jgi:hypothetical protein
MKNDSRLWLLIIVWEKYLAIIILNIEILRNTPVIPNQTIHNHSK